MKIRARSTDAEPAPLPTSRRAVRRAAWPPLLVSARRVEPYRIDAVRGAGERRHARGEADRGRRRSPTTTSPRTLAAALRRRRDRLPAHRPGAGGGGAAAAATTAPGLRALPVELDGDAGRRGGRSTRRPSTSPRSRRRSAGRCVATVTTHRDLDRALDTAYKATGEVGSQIQAFEARDSLRREAEQLETAQVNEEAPVVQVVQMIITQALRDRASDIHIEPSGDRVRVRYRIDGALNDVLDLPGSIGPAVVSRVKILGGMNIVERRRPQDGQISMEVEGREVDIRVSSTAVVGGEKVVMRLLDKCRPLFDLEQLGMPPETAARYSAMIHAPYGMVICAGPTGGGKTTTLYASLGELNTPDRNIMTIEDPVEYTFDSINQIQINEQAGITFAGGLKSILRQDPDVILVGEIRDVDTARIAVQSALTGHLVLSSLHATESVAALYRLLDMGIEAFLIASSVTAVVAQRLVRRNCPHCRGALRAVAPRSWPSSAASEEPASSRSRSFRHGVGLPLLRAHRLPGADRRLRAAAGHRRGARARRRARPARRDAQARPEPGHAHAAGAGGAPGPRRVDDAAEVMRSIYVAGV